ncbi:MAG: Holliday junction resolvase RuvX [Planctomycetota bacterium]
MGRLLGVDYGDRRIGLALSDPSGTLARPFRVVAASPKLAEELKDVALREGVERIVLGFPRNMDGSIGPKARQVLEFRAWLERELGLPVDLWDERLSTVEASRLLEDAGLSREERGARVDQVAAQRILQNFLDARAAGGRGDGEAPGDG